MHAEMDGPGTDGASFWIERRLGRDGREGNKRYMLAGDGLESKPVVSRAYPDVGGELVEDLELMMQGYQGTVFMQNRKVQFRLKTKNGRGSLAFFNTTKGTIDDVHFADVRITALRHGPLEISGTLGRRELAILKMDDSYKDVMEEEDPTVSENTIAMTTTSMKTKKGPSMFSAKGGGNFNSTMSTLAPDSPTRPFDSHSTFAKSTFNKSSDFRITMPAQMTPAKAKPGQHANLSLWQNAGRPSPKARLKQSASDMMLNRTATGSLPNLSPASRVRSSGDNWLPFATNAPAREQHLLQDTWKRKLPRKGACQDFIAM